jgi:hypothetical protein
VIHNVKIISKKPGIARLFSVSSLNYDANGNILKMTQKGWKVNTSPIIDSLAYTYITNSKSCCGYKMM